MTGAVRTAAGRYRCAHVSARHSRHSAPPLPAGPARYAPGRQYELRRGDALAVVTELAAGLRSYGRDGVQLTETYGDGESPRAPPASRWRPGPTGSRTGSGTWTARNSSWTSPKFRGTTPATACCGTPRTPGGRSRRSGHPSRPRSSPARLSVPGPPPRPVRRGRGPGARSPPDAAQRFRTAGPFVLGAHPYLRLGDAPSTDLVLTVDAGSRLVADERLIPRSAATVAGMHRAGRHGRCLNWLSMSPLLT